MLVQKLSLTQNLSGTNAITFLSYINLTSSSRSISLVIPIASQYPLITVCLDPEASEISRNPIHLLCRKRKTVSRKARNISLKRS